MATVHTAYGPGEIVDRETVRGRTQYKVAGDGFEVWIDEAKLGAYDRPGDVDLDAPHWQGYDLGDKLTSDAFGGDGGYGVSGDEYDEYADPRGQFKRDRMRTPVDYEGYGDAESPDHYARRRQAWAPMDHDNSTELPYNPDPQHDAVGQIGYDDGSSTIQPIHHIDADERLRSSDSVTFEDEDDDGGPGPNPDLFARQGAVHPDLIPSKARDYIKKKFPASDAILRGVGSRVEGEVVSRGLNVVDNDIDSVVNAVSPGPGWGDLIKGGSRHEANPAALLAPALMRAVGPAVARGLAGQAASGLANQGAEAVQDFSTGGPEDGWGDLVKPAGLSDKYIDLTASADYWNDPVAQFRHDPDAYINRVGHLMDEGLNPRFAEYMDLVEADGNVRTAAWKDVRKKAMRLKTSGAVHVRDIAPTRIMASVDGDHGTYEVQILKGASYGDQSIANWHCGCEWGKWAFRRKFSYVGRLCSHAYASYLTMQSAALSGQSRPQRRGPSDMVIVKRKPKDRYLPTYQMTAGLRTADNLQDGPQRLTPDMVVNDTDDAHMFMDVTKDERDDTGPDDVVSEKDIVHFARLMRHCEITQRPYPRQLVAFLSRYAGCADDSSDDTQSDYEAHDADDANEYLEQIRADGDRKQSEDFGSMAERVHKIQDAVEEARAHGADADRFVAMLRTAEETAPPGFKAVPGGAPGTQLYREDPSTPAEAFGKGNPDRGIEVGPDGVKRQVSFDGSGTAGVDGNKFEYDGGAYSGPRGKVNPDDFVKNFPGKAPKAPDTPKPAGPGDPRLKNYNNSPGGINPNNPGGTSPKEKAPSENSSPKSPPANNTPTVGTGNQDGGTGGTGGDGGSKGGDGGSKASGTGTGTYTAPGGGQTSGTIADGGVAGAENGNNDAITKTSPNVDANGMYTVQKGDTWSDIAQRTTGDMNNYQRMYDLNKDVAGGNIDSLAEGTQVNLKDFLNDTGNAGVRGDVTNPAGGGKDNNPATADAGPSVQSGAGGLSTANGLAGGAPGLTSGTPEATTTAVPGSTGGDTTAPAAPAAPAPAVQPAVVNEPKPVAGNTAEGSLRTAKDWLRWAAENDGTATNPSDPDNPTQGQDGTTNTVAPSTPSPGGSNSATPGTVTPLKDSDTYDPMDPTQNSMPQNTPGSGGGNASQPGNQGMGLGLGRDMGSSGVGDTISNIGGSIGDAVGSFLPGIGGAISGISSGIGNAIDTFSGMGQAMNGMGQPGAGGGQRAASQVFSSREDFDDWVRYAYPADGGSDFDPKTLPHIPFAGSGNPGPLEFSTSEEYADKARKKMDDVTDLGDGDLTQSMGEWQKQSSRREAGGLKCRHENWEDFEPGTAECYDCGEIIPKPYNPEDSVEGLADRGSIHLNSVGYSTDDDSDIVRTFQAHLGETALGAGAGAGAGRFDDIAGAAQGFLRTAGRNYSLAEQDELVREGDKGGARNLASLDLKGTHYEDMNTLGW